MNFRGALDAEDDVFGGEWRAVVKAHWVAQLEALVGRI
jgi:hypothetical protein